MSIKNALIAGFTATVVASVVGISTQRLYEYAFEDDDADTGDVDAKPVLSEAQRRAAMAACLRDTDTMPVTPVVQPAPVKPVKLTKRGATRSKKSKQKHS